MISRPLGYLFMGSVSLTMAFDVQAQALHRLKSQRQMTNAAAGIAVPMLPMITELPPEALADIKVSLTAQGPVAEVVAGNPGPAMLPSVQGRQLKASAGKVPVRSGGPGPREQAAPAGDMGLRILDTVTSNQFFTILTIY